MDAHETRTPYRIQIFAVRYRPVRRRRTYTEIELAHVGWDGWNPVQHYQEARLPGAGSFLYPGMHAVYRAAMEALAQPGVHQVSIRTNQDRQVYRYFKSDKGITGYYGTCD